MLFENKNTKNIVLNCLLAAISLFINGFGIYLTIRADLGASPWDVLNLGISNTFHILYGNASVTVAFIILAIDVFMKEPIGLSMIIDAVVVGKSVDFFNWLNIVPVPSNFICAIILMIVGLFIIGATQYTYMLSSLGCGPRDTLLVGLKKRITRFPIGVVSIGMLSIATLVGYLLGGKVGVGTLICALLAGPIMQLCFDVMHFDATKIQHQSIQDSIQMICKK